jgi:hypothetical protein
MEGMDASSNLVVQMHEAARRRAVAGTTVAYTPRPLQHTGAATSAGEGTLVADGEVVKAVGDTRRRFEQQLADHPAEIRDSARVLAHAVREQITELKAARRNDVESADFIEFLEMVARELDMLVDALDRAIESSADPILLGEAKKIADHLKGGFHEYLEKHRTDIAGLSIKLGLVSAAGGFLYLCGFDLASIVSILKK